MISKINKSIIRDIFSFINYKKVLILSKGNKKLCEINKITIKTLEIVNEVIQYYKKVNKDGIQTYNISPFKIDSDNDSIMNDFFEEIENKYEGESNENIQTSPITVIKENRISSIEIFLWKTLGSINAVKKPTNE